jgi:hypothetical protein
MSSFDDFLENRVPDSRRKAYYLMAIHESLTRVSKQPLREIGWTKARELAKVARREGGRAVRKCTLGAQGASAAERRVQAGGRTTPNGKGNGGVGDPLLQALQEPATGPCESPRNGRIDARNRQVARLLLGNDLCGFSCRCERGRRLAAEPFAPEATTTETGSCGAQRTSQKKVLNRDGWRCQICGSRKSVYLERRYGINRLERCCVSCFSASGNLKAQACNTIRCVSIRRRVFGQERVRLNRS